MTNALSDLQILCLCSLEGQSENTPIYCYVFVICNCYLYHSQMQVGATHYRVTQLQ